jgi:glycosyltransferase involved in cell wall biosynthesis
MSRDPQVSVVMPIYNAQRWLREAIESILTQTLSEFELIAVDDGSTDASAEIVRSYADTRIALIRQTNQGAAPARNAGTLAASGEYIAYMDADDISEPQRLRMQSEFLDRHGEVATVGCSAYMIDEYGAVLFNKAAPTGTDRCRRRLFAERYCSFGASLMIRRPVLLERGLERTFFRNQEDTDLLLRIAERYDIDNVPDVLYRYRINTSGLSHADPGQGPYYGEVAFQLHRERMATGSDRLQRGEALVPYVPQANRNVCPNTLRRVLCYLHLEEAQSLLECGAVWSALGHLSSAMALEPFRPNTVRACWRVLRSRFNDYARRS